MNSGKIAVAGVVAVCALAMAGEVFSAGGQRLQRRDGSCLKTSTSTSTQTRTQTQGRQRLQDGSGSGGAISGAGAGQGQMRKLGPGDGTGNITRPMDGTGYGSPNK
jgi:hypothetical protein